jgi:hypothetical protein
MAGVGFKALAVAVTTGTGAEKTLLQLVAPANQGLEIKRVRFDFKGAAGDPKIKCEVVDQSTAGSGSSAADIFADPPNTGVTVQTAAAKGHTTEPTLTRTRESAYVSPYGDKEFYFPDPLVVAPGGRLGFRVYNSGTACDGTVTVSGRE